MLKTHRHDLKHEMGSGKTWVLVILLIATVIVVGFKVMMLQFEHQRIVIACEDIADRAFIAKSHGLEESVSKTMATFDAKVDPTDVKIELTENPDRVTLDFTYRRIINYILVKRSYAYNVHVERYPKRPVGAIGDAVEKSIEKSNENASGRYQEAFKSP